MAYSLYEKPQLRAAKNIQYYPEEYDYSDYYNVVRMKNIETPVPTPRKYKKTLPTIDYENERKCPIYIHQFNKPPNLSTYNNFSPRNCEIVTKAKQLPPKKSKPQNTKLTLDKLEETYWATWKPNKEPKATKNTKTRTEKEAKADNKPRNGVSEHIFKYFAACDFPTSSGSVLNGVENSEDRLETATTTQEIQTDYVPPIILLENEKQYDSTSTVSEKLEKMGIPQIDETNTPEPTLGDAEASQDTVITDNDVISVKDVIADNYVLSENDVRSSETLMKEDKVEEEEGITTAKTPKKKVKKLLKHTDSFIIHKKKQDEIKDDVQQPRCIKLYKKTATTFLKGGSYPLKSCMAKVSSEKRNFRLGAPGSPLFVTSSSFNKKYSR